MRRDGRRAIGTTRAAARTCRGGAIAIAWLLCAALSFLLPATRARAEDGYDLWLRYPRLPAAEAAAVAPHATGLRAPGASPTAIAARDELLRGFGGLLGKPPPLLDRIDRDGAIVVGTPATLPQLARFAPELAGLGDEGYLLRSASFDGHPVVVVAANSGIGALHGAFHLLRLVQSAQPLSNLDIREAPKLRLRVLDHWDNLDRYVERGYAGESIWDWHKLPGWLDPRYTDYARANASIGINGAVLNNVNADAQALTPMYLAKVEALAGVLRPYGIRVYLSARFDAPIGIGGLMTADPLDPAVRAWWKARVDAIYARIPDFGGFLVKAGSEGQPGPQEYGRTHADGANMLAAALAPHGGVVMWRAFVYSHGQPDDRAKQAYDEFVPLDGKFAANVLLQVKNGPIDFQPREPFHPLFGAMPKTPLMMEFQITKEYLGFATHLAYLAPLYAETLRSDTFARGAGSTVARVIDGSLEGHVLTGMAGVANIGSDRNWTGSQFDQANWYAFGRLAWNPDADPRAIAEDWVRTTFTNDPAAVAAIVGMMMGSRQAVVDYMTPLGLHHLMGRGHHYGPAPWTSGGPRADWTSVYYHRADAEGIGFDRTATGSNAVAQYAPPLAAKFGDIATVPEDYLLWFHHVAWSHRMADGDTLWDELVHRYGRGIAYVHAMRATWDGLSDRIDPERHAEVAAFLAIQEREAQWWRDASIAYFRSFSKRPLPPGEAPPAHALEYYESLQFPHAPGDGK